jgi:hypothetical protein
VVHGEQGRILKIQRICGKNFCKEGQFTSPISVVTREIWGSYSGFDNSISEEKSPVTARKYRNNWNNCSKLKRKRLEWRVDLTVH